MRLITTIFILLCVSLAARENPFKELSTSQSTGKAIHKKDTRESFVSVKTQLPSSARILKSIEFHFQNLDGSLESKIEKVNKKIDWQDKLIVKKLLDDEVVSTAPIKIVNKKETSRLKKINFKNIVLFSIDGKSIHIKTKDKKIRDFLVTSPYKVIIDFKREISFYTKVYNLKNRYFKSITLGKHAGYYRVAIELDGRYLYNKQKVKDGYVFSLR